MKKIKRKVNPCAGLAPESRLEGQKRWARIEPFVPSTKGILRYQESQKHKIIFTGRGNDKKATTDVKAIKTLIGQHPGDQFYPAVLEDRELTKLGGTYIGWLDPSTDRVVGGFPVGRDGRIHGHFRHSPSTLRSSMVAPNLQNLPRGNDSEVQRWVKQMFVADYGYEFVARDYEGIEAQLVGVEANDRDFLRLAKLDIHSYFTAHNLYRLGMLTAADLPELSWSDKDIKEYGKRVIKARFNAARDVGKRCIHAGDYRVGPKKLHEEYPEWFPRVKDAAAALGLFYEVFPSINRWHETLCMTVDKSAVVKNAFGHIHRFYQVLNWTKRGNEWTWAYGDDAKRLIAFRPQSNAAFIGKAALKRLYYNYYETAGKWLRLFIHDEIFGEALKGAVADDFEACLKSVMEEPVPEIVLNPDWGYGTCLAIETSGKRGYSWGAMQ